MGSEHRPLPIIFVAMSGSIYFKGFNGVRFIAASAVIVHHLEEYKTVFLLGREDLWARPFVYQLGRQGVSLFFVLSGFLITYLLLAEQQRTGRVDIRKFYIRRILRIWPLYFLTILTGLFVWPHVPLMQTPTEFLGQIGPGVAHFWTQVALYGSIFPNVAVALYGAAPMVSHTWSIGVEEQFYLMWPWLILSPNPKRTIQVVLSVVAVLAGWFLYERFIVRAVYSSDLNRASLFGFLAYFLAQFRIGCMAIGGAGAWLLFRRHPVLPLLFRRDVQAGVYALLALALAVSLKPTGFNYEFYALFFCFAILNLAGNPHSLLKLDNALTRFMGDISYGLYMYHPLALTLLLNLLIRTWPAPLVIDEQVDGLLTVILYVTTFGLTTLLAWLSYRFFEQPFLRLKDRFAVVASSRRAPVH